MDIEGSEFEIIEGMLPTSKNLSFPTLFISIHYSQLNERIYQQRVGVKYLSLALMKIEKILNFYFFKKRLLQEIKCIVDLAKMYAYTYSESGDLISEGEITSELLLKHEINLVMVNQKWESINNK